MPRSRLDTAMPPSLATLEPHLAADFPTRRIAPSPDAPLGQLAIALDPDGHGRERVLYLMLIPSVNDEDLHGLQLFAPLPFHAPEGGSGVLARLLLLINAAAPLIGFGLREDDGWVFFRCILPVAQGRALDSSEVMHAVWLIYSCLDRFSDTIEAVASGRWDYPQARDAVNGILSSLSAAPPAPLPPPASPPGTPGPPRGGSPS